MTAPRPSAVIRFCGRLAALCLIASGLVAGVSAAQVAAGPEAGTTPRWQRALDRVVPAVVVLRISVPRSFDTEMPADELATGFVVDAERGLIVTNRHVVNPGPATIEAVFLDHEEVPVRAVYRDPIHDFGIVRYDPAEVEFMEPGELSLVPEHARVGTEIRVVGNDAGEKLSILAGTLARLDREAPDYGHKRYSDFNTFYYQAASSTSGGSSGSPVVDVHGHVVALNAGGRRSASSSFYLPLESIVRALEQIRTGKPVARGTLQAVFGYRPYDEVRRLGLRPETEAKVRLSDPDGTGMLVVQEIVPGGPADGKLEVGDVLTHADGRLVTKFGPLGMLLDDSVGRDLAFEVERGGQGVAVEVTVGDLHAITPAEYLEMGAAVIHQLSYQQARNYGVRAGGVYLASAGYMFSRAGLKRGEVITAVGGEPVANLDEFEARMESFAHGERVPMRVFDLERLRTEEVAIVTVDRMWFKMQRCRRDDSSGEWPCEASADPPPLVSREASNTSFETDAERPVRDLAASMAMVATDIPFRVDGIHGQHFRGAGLVVDAERGLVVVDRETVPIALGDVSITFAESVQIPAEVFYLHPAHNLALLSYDPLLLGDTPVRSATLRPVDFEVGDDVWLVGLSSRERIISRETQVSRVEAPRLLLKNPPRFRQTNIELVGLADTESTLGGVICDGKGRVTAIWSAFSVTDEGGLTSQFAGIPVRAAVDMLEIARSDETRHWRSLGVELMPINLAEARHWGLSEAAAREIENRKKSRRRVLSIVRTTAGTAAATLLQEGDLLLAVDGRPAESFADVERASQAEQVTVTVLRDRREIEVEVATTAQSGRGTDRFLFWAGAVLQAPHPAVASQYGVERVGVYVSWLWYGSPANRSELLATDRIVEFDGVPVPDLDAFLVAAMAVPNGQAVRLKTVDLAGKTTVVTLKADPHFWPMTEIRRMPSGWQRIEHEEISEAR